MSTHAGLSARGIHHITAIASSASENLAFYTGVLGLRLVKRTVNFDDPHTYHLYYGDENGTPGTLLTFFPWEGAPAGQPGSGMVTSIAMGIPAAARDFWVRRLQSTGVAVTTGTRFDEAVIGFCDPHGLPLELVAVEELPPHAPWSGSTVPVDCQIRGVHSAAATVLSRRVSEALLIELLGMRRLAGEGKRTRFHLPGTGPGLRYDLVEAGEAPPGVSGGGTVHHIAFRATDAAEQDRWRALLVARGISVTPVIDRTYFRSIYFREAGGVLFEIATDPPGFAIDELPTELGRSLMLPPRYEPMRAGIERALPVLPADPSPGASYPTAAE
jgi:glyoxalase family protein